MKLPKPTTEQAAILKDKSACKIVVAVPGSGKTTLLFQAAKQELKQNGTCLLVSFTKRVEAENILKVEKYFPQHKKQIKVQTFDSFCNQIVCENWKNAGYIKRPEFDVVFDDKLFNQICKEIKRERLDFNIKVSQAREVVKNSILKQISLKRSSKNLTLSFNDDQLKQLKTCAIKYAKFRRSQGIFSHNEAVTECFRIIKKYPAILDQIANKYSLLLVDELQDLSETQLKIAIRLAEEIKHSVFVGDDAQTIYDFRGVRDDNIQLLQRTLQCNIFSLTYSHRCTKEVSAFATNLRNNIAHVHECEMQSNKEGNLPQLLGFKNRHKQYSEVAKQITVLHQQGVSYSCIAIIARLHKSLAQVQRDLQDASIPFETRFTQEFDVELFNDLYVNFLVVLFEEDITEALESLFFFIEIEFTPDHIDYIKKELISNNKHERHHSNLRLKSLGRVINNTLKADTLEAKLSFVGTFLSNQYSNNTRHYLKSHLTHINVRSRHIENYKELIIWIKQLNFVRGDNVSLMTTHASKGLEFDHVFITDADDYYFPFKKSKQHQDNINSEKKKLYVAITRSSNSLVITSLNNDKRKPTKFITRIKQLKSLITMRMNRKIE